MPTEVDSPSDRAPQQRRSRVTHDRFLEVTRDLLEERSFEELTVLEIATRAGRTVGAFYGRFESKDSLLYELISTTYARIRDVVRAFCDPVRWEDSSLAEFLAESTRLNVGAYRQAGSLFRASLVRATTDQRFRDARVEIMRFAAEEQKRFILSRRDEARCADPARASDRIFETVAASLDHELLFGRFTSTGPTNDAELVDDLTTRACQLLGVAPPQTS